MCDVPELGAAEEATGGAAVRSAGGVCVAPAEANGTLLVFVGA
jgi:hypothetical protein